MDYAIESISSISGDRWRMTAYASVRPRTNSFGVWYYPVYGWHITRSYRTEFTGTVSVSTEFSQPSTVNFYLCGPVDEDHFMVEVDPDTGLPNLPIIRQATIYNPGSYDAEEGNTVSASFNIGTSYDNTELAANETYILFAVRVGANTSDGAVRTSFTATCTDDGPPDGEWYIFHAPWYAEVDTSGYSVSNLFLPDHNLLCFPIDHESKEGSWTVEISAEANVLVFFGNNYRWSSAQGIPSTDAQPSGPGTSFRVSDIPSTYSFIWVRFASGASSGNVSINISFMETQVQTYWHSETVVPVWMNNGNALPATGSETWSSGLGEKGVLVYRFKLSQNFAPEFSYSGSQPMWMCISTVYTVNDMNGMPNPQSGMIVQGNGTNITIASPITLTAGVTYYIFIETTTGDPYDGQIVITYGAAPLPEPKWSYGDVSTQTDILVSTTRDVTLTAQTGVRFQVSFRFTGRADFSVSGVGTDAYIYATSGNYGFSSATGRPKDINGNELSDGTSTAAFVATGTTTYIWVRGQDVNTAGTVTITITPPSVVWTEDVVGAKSVAVRDEAFVESYELSVQQTMVYRYDITFSRSGTVRFYSVGSTAASDVVAYFSSIPRTFDRTLGRPDNYDEMWSDAEPGNYNFASDSLSVSAGTTYYLWVRGVAADTTASIRVNISGGGSSGGKKDWIWNGSSWIQITPYGWNGSSWIPLTAGVRS